MAVAVLLVWIMQSMLLRPLPDGVECHSDPFFILSHLSSACTLMSLTGTSGAAPLPLPPHLHVEVSLLLSLCASAPDFVRAAKELALVSNLKAAVTIYHLESLWLSSNPRQRFYGSITDSVSVAFATPHAP